MKRDILKIIITVRGGCIVDVNFAGANQTPIIVETRDFDGDHDPEHPDTLADISAGYMGIDEVDGSVYDRGIWMNGE